MKLTFPTLVLALALAIWGASAPVLADAPQPVKPVPVELYSGRWYEIARTNNRLQADCEAATNDFSGWSGGAFSVVQTCHKGSPGGPVQTYNAKGRVLPSSNNTKIRLGYFGGLVSIEYWIVDRSDDNVWAIMSRADGHYVWLISRKPVLDPSVRNRAMARIQALGFDMSRIVYPKQPPG